MKRFVRIGLRLVGLGLVAFILTQIPYRDRLEWMAGGRIERQERGTIISQREGSVSFRRAGEEEARVYAVESPDAPRIRRGVISIVRGADKRLLAVALLLFGPISVISVTRWWILLRAIGIPIRYLEALRLTYIGFFFNSAVPGLTGGDVVKAFYIARGSPAPYKAVVSVFVDRVFGMLGLAVLASAIIGIKWRDGRFEEVKLFILLYAGILFAACFVLVGRTARRLFRVDAIIARLPLSRFVAEVDRAVTVYRDHPVAAAAALLLSVLNHTALMTMSFTIARSLGIAAAATDFFAIIPVCMIIAAIPVVPGGWGMREGAFAIFFRRIGIPPEASVPVSLLLGLSQLAWSLLGGIVFIARPDRASVRELEAFGARIEATAPAAGPPPP
ncbi:MAG: flippase-like domain-containing protein [Planctomycetes bacterium]|nr:flippase-like domain-containing protein [Planctomycetota bacterium]